MSLVAKITTYCEAVALDDCTQAFAEPNANNLVDLVHPVTGLSTINGESLEEIRKRYPNAEVVNVEEWMEAKALRQEAPFVWDGSSEEHYEEMLNCLPPACYIGYAFLVGEPWDHSARTGEPRFQALRMEGGKYYASSRPMTVKEFRGIFASR